MQKSFQQWITNYYPNNNFPRLYRYEVSVENAFNYNTIAEKLIKVWIKK